jgi:hypothetical protein
MAFDDPRLTRARAAIAALLDGARVEEQESEVLDRAGAGQSDP